MKVEIESTEYHVYWSHRNNIGLTHKKSGQPIKSTSQAFIAITTPNNEVHLLTGHYQFDKNEYFHRREGMKSSFKQAVSKIDNKSIRTTLWGAYLNLRVPKPYYHNERPYRYVREVLIKTADGGWVMGILYEALYATDDNNKYFVRTRDNFIAEFKQALPEPILSPR